MRSELFIGGSWRLGRGTEFGSIDPWTGAQVWSGRAASSGEVADAMQAAKRAFPEWARTPLADRVAVAQRFAAVAQDRAPRFVEAIGREMGKPAWDARAEMAAVVGKVGLSVKAQAERAGHSQQDAPFGRLSLEHRPLGPLAVLGPFNFPAHLPNGHLTPALLAGNTIVFKPSEATPGVGALLVEAWADAGLPAGVLNLVQGKGDIGAALVGQPDVAGVLFTGSAHAGAAIHRSFAGRPEVMVALEMGGNAPLLVWPACDPVAAANLIVQSAFLTSGQRCSCARRLILPEGAFGEDVIAATLALARSVKIGSWDSAPEPFMGPLASVAAAGRVRAFEAAMLAAGGRSLLSSRQEGAVLTPSLVDVTGVNVEDEEAFGPLLQVIRVPSLEAGIAVANATRFGLAAGVITDDPAIWQQAGSQIRAGVLNWNRPTTGASGALPFGGPGASGSLRPSAYYAADYCAYPVATQAADVAVATAVPGLGS
ncbi:MAG: succinylglutamate-semialdehyde dehydrogenase [Caulobacterales bacterium]|jgi:succinylglutamic semialdehyde dehydrogenase